MNEKDLAYPDFSTTVRFEDLENLAKDLQVKSIGLSLNMLSYLSVNQAADQALKIFSKNRTKKFTPRGAFSEVESEVLMVGKRDISVYRFGNPRGPKALLCHGWGGQASDFYRMIHPLIDMGYEIITFDGPAHGQSSGTHTNIFEFVEVIEEIAKNEGEIKVAIGHSMGGIALALASHFSQNFRPEKLIEMGAPNKLQSVFDSYSRILGLNENIQAEMRNIVEKLTGLKFNEVKLESFMNSRDNFKTMLVHDELDKIVPFKRAQEIIDNANVSKVLRTFGLGHVKILRNEDVITEVMEFIRR